MTAARSAALWVALLVLVTACSGSFSIGGLSQEDLETEIESLAEETAPEYAPYDADCSAIPDDPEEGDTFECSVTDTDGDELPVSVVFDADGGATFTINP